MGKQRMTGKQRREQLICVGRSVFAERGFEGASVENSLPAMTISGPIVAFVLGYLVLGEKFQVSGYSWIYIVASLIAMVTAAIALSRHSPSA